MKIFSVSIDDISREALLQRVLLILSLRERQDKSKKSFRIATVNPEFLLLTKKDIAFAQSLACADVRVRDGVGIALAYWLRGRRAPERITGADLVIDFLELANKNSWTIFIANRKDGLSTFAEIQKAIQKKYPKVIVGGEDFEKETQGARRKAQGTEAQGARVKAQENPTSKFPASPAGRQIPNSNLTSKFQIPNSNLNLTSKFQIPNSHFIFCTFGMPEQEFFLSDLQKQNIPAIMMGVGGAFDFLTGKQKRAPRWIQRIGLEWLVRLVQQPKRLIRIFRATGVFPFFLLRDCLMKKEEKKSMEI